MKLALLLALINPAVGGVLLIGPRGTGKTTAVRGLVDLMPPVQRSTCLYGCKPEAARSGVGRRLSRLRGQAHPGRADHDARPHAPGRTAAQCAAGRCDRRRERARGGGTEQGAPGARPAFDTDQNLLYVDEVNLLSDEVADAILDAAAQGIYTVRRGPLAATYRSRIVLVGSMNPEEGQLRPQIQDRFGLRVLVRGLTNTPDRLEVYRRVSAYQANPHALRAAWVAEDAGGCRRNRASARTSTPGQTYTAGRADGHGLGQATGD